MPQKKAKNSDKPKGPPQIIGKAYDQLKYHVKRAAKTDIPILLIGERGSGKEVFAQYYMTQNDRNGKKMAVNCAAFPEDMLRSEIFGHVGGVFTDVKKDRSGKLIYCDGGILFLDELGDASGAFQAAILRVVEQNSFSQLGSDKEETDINTLVIAATNKPQALRDDIKDRFNIFYVPPLQIGDIPALATYFLQGLAEKTDAFPKQNIIDTLAKRKYPGNVRELKTNCDRLFSEHRNAALGNRRPQPLPDVPPFDYERFVREYQFWLEYIQPIIEKVNLAFNLSYVYQPWNNEIHKCEISSLKSAAFITSDFDDITDFQFLRHGVPSSTNLTINLETIIKHGDLPPYIKWLQSQLNPDSPPSSQNDKPDLWPLLDMVPPEDAFIEFKRCYFQYHKKKNDSNMEKTAQSLGTNANALRQKITRLK
jgi:DNA-binding NtrC family response regulator